MLEKLKKLGLSEKEAQIYQALIKQGETTANKVAKQTSTNRTVTYNVLQQLIEKGLVAYVHKDKKRFFHITKPNSLLASIKEKETLAKDLIIDINKVSTALPSYKNVEVYEGKEGMRAIHEEIRQAKNLKVLNATGLIYDYLKYSAGHIVKDIELGSNCKIIAVQSMKKTPLAKLKNSKIKYLPKKAENYATTFIFQGKVIIQVLKDKPFLIKIENKEIFDGYQKDFSVLWNKL